MNQADPNFWLVLHSSASNAAENMAVDAALLEVAPTLSQPLLRFYSWTEPAASFGYFQKFSDVAAVTHLRPLVRRPTGGGLVPHDADWTYSAIFPPGAAWYGLHAVESYQRMHEWIRAAFATLGVATALAAECRKALPGQCFVGHEKYDVLLHGQKIAGAAQRRTRNGLLIQGSVQVAQLKISRTDWERAMLSVASESQGISWTEFQPGIEFKEQVAEFAAKIYSQAEHNQRR